MSKNLDTKIPSLKNGAGREENISVNKKFEKGDSSRRNGKIVSKVFPKVPFLFCRMCIN